MHHYGVFAINTVWLWAWAWKAFTTLRVGAAVTGGTAVWQPVAVSGTVDPFLGTRDITAIFI
jgi:hypothetical protein